MIANFKNENKIIITGADRAEALLISQLVNESKAENKELTLTEFYDIDGDVNGLALELKDKVIQEPVTSDSEQILGE